MFIALAAVLTSAVWADDASDPHRTLDAKSLAAVRDTVGRLIQIVDELQEAIVQDLQAEKKKTLYRQAEDILADLEKFQTSLKTDVAREDAYTRFETIDAKVQRLLAHFQSFGISEKSLVLPSTRMQFVTDELHYTLSLADPAKGRIRQALERQARDLVIATKNLQKTAEFAIGDTQARSAILGDLAKLTQDAQTVSDDLVKKASSASITTACESLTATWTRVIDGIKLLSQNENTYLLRTASRVDLLHERVFRLSEMKGHCPRLVVNG